MLSLTVGINLGTDIGGGSQIEITLVSTDNVSGQIKDVESVLKNNNLSSEKVFVEDKLVDTLIVVRIAKKDIKNADTIRTQIAEKLEIGVENVSEIASINGMVTKKAVIWTSVAIICLLLVVFVFGWIRYKIIAGLSLMITLLHTLLLGGSLLIITRLPINFVSLIILLCGVVFVLFAMVLTLERIRENASLKHNENLTTLELVNMSKHSVLKPLIVFAVLVLVVSVVFVCVPVSYVALSACCLIVCLASCIYSYYFVGMGLHEFMLDLKVANDKAKLSRNVTTLAKDEKAVEKKTTKKVAKTEKAEKAKNLEDKSQKD